MFTLRYIKTIFYRNIKKPLLLIILCLIPILGLLYHQLSGEQENGIPVALYVENGDELAKKSADSLIRNNSIYSFYLADSISSLKADVEAGRCECGYDLSIDLQRFLDMGLQKNQVRLYASSSTTMDHVINEVVYAAIFENYALHILKDYIHNESVLSDEEISDYQIESLFQKHLTDGSTFGFDIQGGYTEFSSANEGISIHLLIGILGILVLLSALSGLLSYGTDLTNGVLGNMPKRDYKLAALSHILCPLILTGCFTGITFIFIGYFKSPLNVMAYLAFLLSCLLLCLILTPFIRYRMTVLILIPFYLIACLVFTPVFMDLSLYIRAIRFIRFLFIPNILYLFS